MFLKNIKIKKPQGLGNLGSVKGAIGRIEGGEQGGLSCVLQAEWRAPCSWAM